MRYDDIGIFWEDTPRERGERGQLLRPMPEIPETRWETPKTFPRLRSASHLAIDLETYDPGIASKTGPGWSKKAGHVVGVAVGAPNGQRWYFPIRHETEPETNLDPVHVFAWLQDTLDAGMPLIGANIIYDAGWLKEEGVVVNNPLYDVQLAEALLSEGSPVALDYLGQKYLKERKKTELLYEWLSQWFGGSPGPAQRKWIYKAPPRLVGPYAEGDVDLPLRILPLQYKEMKAQGLLDVFEMECGLIPLMIEMRFAGVRVDVDRAEEVYADLTTRVDEMSAELKRMSGMTVPLYAPNRIAAACEAQGIWHPVTAKGAPSFTKGFMTSHEHPFVKLLAEARELTKVRDTFIKSYILESNVNGRVHGEFHLLKGESGGTRSGRFSSSNPNLQNLPSRHPVLGPLVRSIFVPDIGHLRWRKMDYSQIEYRMMAHHAIGKGSNELRAAYQLDPRTDYHEMVRRMILELTGVELIRSSAKNINFGLIYGMGQGKLGRTLGLSQQEAEGLFESYHAGAPFVKATMDACIQEASLLGYITTVMGRRSRFDLWEPFEWSRDKLPPLPLHRAQQSYGLMIKRAMTHKALNRRLQGGAADLMKKAMLECYRAGLFAEVGWPRLTVHDELDFSDPGGKDSVFEEIKRTLESALPLSVPVLCEESWGGSWGEAK